VYPSAKDDGNVMILIRQNNWGCGTANAGAVPTIPEPATMLLLSLGGLAVIRRREKKSRIPETFS